jgi:putative MATE family efflux protein
MFNALGKSRIPLYFLIFSSVFNIWLDYVSVTGFHMGVAGVAWATLIAQGISAVLSFLVFMHDINKLDGGQSKIFDKSEMVNMTRVALPSILQQSTVSIGMMLVQSVVNSFGSQALAGFSAAMRIEAICVVPMNGIGSAISSYTAQNIGAGKKERVVKGYHSANWMVLISAVIICAVLELFNTQIISVFLGNDQTAVALDTGKSYLAFMGWFFVLLGLKMAVGGLLRGAGDMKMFTIGNLVNLFIRVSLSMILAPKYGISMIWIAVPIGWFTNGVISYVEYRTGKWKNIYAARA